MSADLTLARLLADKRMHVGSAIRKRLDEAAQRKHEDITRIEFGSDDDHRGGKPFKPGDVVTVNGKKCRVVRAALTWIEVRECHG